MTASSRHGATEQIMRAAWEIFVERGLPGVTMEEIAARAGVAKTTVYRRWPTKSAILIDALKDHLAPVVAFPQTGHVRDDFLTQIEAVVKLLDTETGRAYLALVAESVHDPDVADALRDRYVTEQRMAAVQRLRAGIERGELSPHVDPEILVESLYGALYYRALVAHLPLDQGYAERLVASVWPTPGVQ